jgi:hypothetical protein
VIGGRIALTAMLVAVLVLPAGGEAIAQTRGPAKPSKPARPRPPLRPGSIEVDAGALWLGGIDFGTATAAITANQTPPSDYPLFRTASQIKPAVAYEGRVGVRITRIIGVEGAFHYSRPSLETRISNDVEDAASLTASSDLSRYVFEVSGVVHLSGVKIGKSGSPFLLGGAGYVRELDGAKALVEAGSLYHAGGGIKYLLSQRRHGLVKGLGFRLDARVYFRDGGFDLAPDDPLRRFFAGGASLLLAF